MAKSKIHINIYILCGLCIVALVLVYLTKPRDSFKDMLFSRFCGSSDDGYSMYTAGYLKFMKEAGLGHHYGFTSKTKLSDSRRVYTEEDCDRLGAIYAESTCFELKDATPNADGTYKLVPDNIKNNFGEKCKGLNEKPGSLRPECKIDDTVPGKQITAFSIKVKGKQVNMPGNALRVYTEDECKELGGSAGSVVGNIINNLRDESKVSKADIKKFTDQVVDEDGNEEYFLCRGSIPFSTVCMDGSGLPSLSSLSSSLPSFSSSSKDSSSSSSDPSFFGDIAESAKTHLKDWLGI
jgi:hypothetical protein